MSLMDSLGLDQIESDPNALPDGKWAGTVFKSEYVIAKSKGTVNHVLTYKVTEGSRKGAQVQEWFNLGTDPQFDDAGKIVGMTPTMDENAKRWYKKRFVDLGTPEDQVSKTSPEALVGKDITFGTKKNGQYINVNFVELRSASATPATASDAGDTPQGVSGLL